MSKPIDHLAGWRIDGNNVIPVNDLRPHVLTDCWCGPDDDDGIMVHHSMDQREMYERGEIKSS
jgi:hypothetical protein